MFDNIRKVVLYLMCDAFEEIIVIIMCLVIGMPLPVTAAQILWINLISD
jgi:Ca2+-transporting ATPase